jgi:uncharacterized protein (DUF1330 family)
MRAYVVVEITIHNPDMYDRYRPLAAASLAVYGGKYLVRGGKTTTLEGMWEPSRFVIVEFPDGDAARAWWNSPEYAEAKALRQASADTEMLLVEGMA